MSYTRHHAIIVTGVDLRDHSGRPGIVTAYYKAQTTFGTLVSALQTSPYNGFTSFCVFPDGSNEGWLPSIEMDMKRRLYLEKIKDYGVQVAHIQYGDEDGVNMLIGGSAEARIKELEAEVKMWKANHDEMVARNKLLRNRPDLPLERVKGYDEMMKKLSDLQNSDSHQ